MVRIHSSKQDGSPVIRVYEVLSDGDKVYRVTTQGDDPNEDVKRLINETERLCDHKGEGKGEGNGP